jgi:MarR family
MIVMTAPQGMRSSSSPGKLAAVCGLRPVPISTLYLHRVTSKDFPESGNILYVGSWTFLTNHARVLLCVAHDPGVRLRDIAASLDITERSAFGIITDLVEAGYVIKEKDGRRNRYRIQAHLPLPEPAGRERTIGEVLALLTGADAI